MKEVGLGKGFYLEVCANSVESALAAQEGGATRIELCQQLEVGGVTPSAGQIRLVRSLLHIGLHVLIRPRGGSFVYSPLEIEEILRDIAFCKDVGCDGVVIGVLLRNGSIDVATTRRLVEAARPMTVTFHRAFDRSGDPEEALEAVIETGCDRLLTSGQQDHAADALDVLARLVERATDRIEIMPGSGVNEFNMREILEKTGAQSIHSSAKIARQLGPHDPVPAGWAPTWVTSIEKVRTMADLLKSF